MLKALKNRLFKTSKIGKTKKNKRLPSVSTTRKVPDDIKVYVAYGRKDKRRNYIVRVCFTRGECDKLLEICKESGDNMDNLIRNAVKSLYF